AARAAADHSDDCRYRPEALRRAELAQKANSSSLLCLVSISQFGQVLCSGSRVQIAEHRICAGVALKLTDSRIRIVQIAEYDGFRWASLLARCHNITVRQFFTGHAHRLLRVVNSLHTVGALLHDPAHADGHFRIENHSPDRIDLFSLLRIRHAWPGF